MENVPPEIKYADLLWNCPLSKDHADAMLPFLKLSSFTTLVDIGCGWGELLIRAAQKYNVKTITGIDTDIDLLARAQRTAEERQLDASFRNIDGLKWESTQDRAICIGSSHALGGTRAMLERLARIVPSGRVLVGDMCWEKSATPEALSLFGDEVLTLSAIVAICQQTGWQILHLSTADQREWDCFESAHRSGTRAWLLENPQRETTQTIQSLIDKRETQYIESYRGVLGFLYLVIGR